MAYNKYDELAKLIAIIGFFLASLYASLILVSSWLSYGVFAYAGLSPAVIFASVCAETLRRREYRSPHKQIGTSTFDDRIFPDDEKREKLIRDFLYRKKPLPWH